MAEPEEGQGADGEESAEGAGPEGAGAEGAGPEGAGGAEGASGADGEPAEQAASEGVEGEGASEAGAAAEDASAAGDAAAEPSPAEPSPAEPSPAEPEPAKEAAKAKAREKGEAEGAAPKRRESALDKLKRQLAENAAEMPPLEGYDLRKATKILSSAGFPLEKVRIRYIDSEEERGLVTRQYPDAGEKIDFSNDLYQIELCVSDSSPIEFLPAIYQRSDISGRNFLKDFLWCFQHIFNQTRDKLNGLHLYFDPLEAPTSFLPWLASWVAMTLEDDWPEVKRRNFIKKAVELYQLRGTVRGIKVYLKIFTGVEPTVYENYWPFDGIQVCPFEMYPTHDAYGEEIVDEDQRKAMARPDWKGATIGEDTVEMPYIDKNHVFTIELPMQQEQLELDTIRRIHRILDREKPAHTDYYLIFQEEEEQEEDFAIEVGIRSTIGVDTWTAE